MKHNTINAAMNYMLEPQFCGTGVQTFALNAIRVFPLLNSGL